MGQCVGPRMAVVRAISGSPDIHGEEALRWKGIWIWLEWAAGNLAGSGGGAIPFRLSRNGVAIRQKTLVAQTSLSSPRLAPCIAWKGRPVQATTVGGVLSASA